MANSNAAYRWPATCGPTYGWLPDQCHGGYLMAAINHMLLQSTGDKILLFPARTKEWDVSFRFHAPKQTTVEVALKGGRIIRIESFSRSPPQRYLSAKMVTKIPGALFHAGITQADTAPAMRGSPAAVDLSFTRHILATG